VKGGKVPSERDEDFLAVEILNKRDQTLHIKKNERAIVAETTVYGKEGKFSIDGNRPIH